MYREGQGSEIMGTKQDVANFIATIIPGYSEQEFNEPVGADGVSLNEFLINKREGSEWTEPHGSAGTEIRISVVNGKYEVNVKKEF